MSNGTVMQIITFSVPVRPGVCKTIWGMNLAPPPPKAETADGGGASQSHTSAVTATSDGGLSAPAAHTPLPPKTKVDNKNKGARGPFTCLYRLLKSPPHWLHSSGIIHDQDIVIVTRYVFHCTFEYGRMFSGRMLGRLVACGV